MIEFQGFPKIARIYRDVVITEKIDGTNSAIGIKDVTAEYNDGPISEIGQTICVACDRDVYAVYAQSRNRIITPKTDNHGFARWVWDNAEALVSVLGPGVHFGEWWGSGIQRGYGLPKGEKRFSLFNTHRWGDVAVELANAVHGLMVVPVLYQGEFSTLAVRSCLDKLDQFGSVASPGFKPAEGVVVYHTAGNCMFKATILNDEKPKSFVEMEKAREDEALASYGLTCFLWPKSTIGAEI